MKLKTFILTVSRNFPTTHKRKGEPTYFEDKILKRYSDFNNFLGWQKLHTIRSNYELWSKRIKQIQEGKAILSIRYWSGKPYNSKQVEICRLDKDSGIGVQELTFDVPCGDFSIRNNYTEFWNNSYKMAELAKNDGLSPDDFKEWFRKYDLSKTMAIIHFTSFRY